MSILRWVWRLPHEFWKWGWFLIWCIIARYGIPLNGWVSAWIFCQMTGGHMRIEEIQDLDL